jgi:hypothetical protein
VATDTQQQLPVGRYQTITLVVLTAVQCSILVVVEVVLVVNTLHISQSCTHHGVVQHNLWARDTGVPVTLRSSTRAELQSGTVYQPAVPQPMKQHDACPACIMHRHACGVFTMAAPRDSEAP